jgi:hypothetical protein
VLPSFDLSYVEEQLAADFADWAPERHSKAVHDYRRFLALCRAYPDKSLGISPDADKVWHRHILNTRRYMADCHSFFGNYFHHTPVSWVEENAAAQQETNRLYLEVFGESRLSPDQMTCVGSGCMNNG